MLKLTDLEVTVFPGLIFFNIIYFYLVKDHAVWLLSPFQCDVVCYPMLSQFLFDLKNKIWHLLVNKAEYGH